MNLINLNRKGAGIIELVFGVALILIVMVVLLKVYEIVEGVALGLPG